jgi:hypothetical protein
MATLMSKPGLCDLASRDFWVSFLPTIKDGKPTGQFDHQRIGDILMQECRKTGAFITSRVRGSK